MTAKETAVRIIHIDDKPATPFTIAAMILLIIVVFGTKIVLRTFFSHLPERTRRIIVFIVVLLYFIAATCIGNAIGAEV